MTSLPTFSRDQINLMKEHFDEHGYVILRGAIAPDDLRNFRNELKSVINAFLGKAGLPPFRGDGNEVFTDGMLALQDRDVELVAAVYDTIFQSPSFFRIVGNRDIEQTVKHLLGLHAEDALYAFTNRCIIAPPADTRRQHGWHQEVFHTIPRGLFLQTWAPLIFDATIENGTIEICPGFHKEGVARATWGATPNSAVLVDGSLVQKYSPVAVEMRLGDLMIFSGYLAHKSGQNTSDKVRYSLVGMYHSVDQPSFQTPKVNFEYRGESPREFYEKCRHEWK